MDFWKVFIYLFMKWEFLVFKSGIEIVSLRGNLFDLLIIFIINIIILF